MKYEARLIIASALGLLLEPAIAADPNDFAVGWPLELVEGSEFYDIPLTADVYRNARSVSQMAVLDAGGDPMPFYRVLAEPEPAPDQTTTLSVSPVYQTQAGEVIAGLTVETAEQVATLRLGSGSIDGARIVGFVADARELDAQPAVIDLDWAELDQPFMTPIVISHSEDLNRWEVIGRGTVASLALDGDRVRHSRIPVNGRSGGYYRIGSVETTPEPWVLERLSLIVESEPDPAPVEWVSLEPVEGPAETSTPDEHALYFDVGGSLPAGALELVFGQQNQWAYATILASDSLDGPWRRVVARRLYYRVEFEGRQLSTPAVEVMPSPTRYWKVLPDRPLDGSDTELRLRYTLERLRFAANGTAPYQLVGGGNSTEAGPDRVFRQVWSQLDDELTGSMAELGEMQELGGDAAFAVPYEFPWRTALLWGALLAAALTVGWMAFRLGRDAFGGE